MWWLGGTAWAQDPPTGDLHGPTVPVADGGAAAPVFVQTAPRGAAGHWAVGLSSEYYTDTARVRYETGEASPLLARGVGTTLAARVGVVSRLELAASFTAVPFVSTAELAAPVDAARVRGAALGDLTLAAPVGLLVPDGEVGLGLGLVPELTVPTGAAERLVSERSVAGGIRIALDARGDRVAFATDALVRGQPAALGADLRRGPVRVAGGAALGVRTAGDLWLHGETRAWGSLGGDAPDPALEAFGTATLRAGPVRLAAGAGRGVVGGLGAAGFRALVSLTVAHEPAGDVPTPDGLEPGGYTFTVRSPEGRPVAGAEVVVDGEVVGVTGLDGTLLMPEEPRWGQGVVVRAPGYTDAEVGRPGAEATPIALAWAPSPVPLAVTDPEGTPLAASVVARPADGAGPDLTLTEGVLLPPGVYEVEIAAAGFGTQHRRIEVYPRTPVEPIDAVLLPATGGRASVSMTIADPEGRPIDGARVLIDGVPVGTTSRGVLTLEGLAPGPHTVEVRHDAFTTSVASELVLTDDAALTLPVAMSRVPGTVRVTVRAPDGHPVDDAIVRFVGPRRLPPMALGSRGERLEVLGAGEWTVTVTSPRYGLQERELVVPEDRYELLPVDIVLQPDEAGAAELVVRLLDPEGEPVEGAAVTIDDRPYGTTSSGGTLTLSGLSPGVRTLGLSRAGLRDLPPRDVVLSAGIQEVLVPVAWEAGRVDVLVRTATGPATDARVRFVDAAGEGSSSPVAADGHVLTTLAPGAWTVVVTSPTAGIQERDLTILPDARSLHRAEFVLAPQEQGMATLSLRVVGPDERPIDGAKVSLDGEPRGSTSNMGSLRLSDLDLGTRNLVVWTEPFEPSVRDLRLLEGEQELEIPLDWATGAVRVHVQRDGSPVTDAVVRFLGDVSRPPGPVDEDGNRLARLEPGFWLVVATSPSAGVAEWDLEVKNRPGLAQVELDMSGVPDGRSDLLVRVIDPYGRPVEHASVWLDGDQKAGETEQGGAVLARSLSPGIVTLRVDAPDFLPTPPVDLELVPGTVERVVRISWPEVPVTVLAIDEHDEPVEALVQWVGPRDVPELKSDGAGRVDATLSPGKWRAIARAADGRPLAGEVALAFELGDEPRPQRIALKPTRAVMEGGSVSLHEMVQFDFGKATLRPDSDPIVEEIARLLVAQPDIVRLEVQGHTDNVGSVALNQALSQQRADAVVRALVARGVAIEKLVAKGFGPTRPIAPNDSEDGRAKNRRVQFVVTERAASLGP